MAIGAPCGRAPSSSAAPAPTCSCAVVRARRDRRRPSRSPGWTAPRAPHRPARASPPPAHPAPTHAAPSRPTARRRRRPSLIRASLLSPVSARRYPRSGWAGCQAAGTAERRPNRRTAAPRRRRCPGRRRARHPRRGGPQRGMRTHTAGMTINAERQRDAVLADPVLAHPGRGDLGEVHARGDRGERGEREQERCRSRRSACRTPCSTSHDPADRTSTAGTTSVSDLVSICRYAASISEGSAARVRHQRLPHPGRHEVQGVRQLPRHAERRRGVRAELGEHQQRKAEVHEREAHAADPVGGDEPAQASAA